jgi:hypothetical protein
VSRIRLSTRGGVLLDGVLALGMIVIGAFVLAHFGFTFSELVGGAARFFAR